MSSRLEPSSPHSRRIHLAAPREEGPFRGRGRHRGYVERRDWVCSADNNKIREVDPTLLSSTQYH